MGVDRVTSGDAYQTVLHLADHDSSRRLVIPQGMGPRVVAEILTEFDIID